MNNTKEYYVSDPEKTKKFLKEYKQKEEERINNIIHTNLNLYKEIFKNKWKDEYIGDLTAILECCGDEQKLLDFLNSLKPFDCDESEYLIDEAINYGLI